MVTGKIRKHGKGRSCNTQYNQPQKLYQAQCPAFPQHPVCRHYNKPEIEAQHTVLDPEHRTRTQSDQKCLPSGELAVQADAAQPIIEREHEKRQGEFLCAAPLEEGRHCIGQCSCQKQKDRIALSGQKQMALPGQAQKCPGRRSFQQPASEERSVGDRITEGIQRIEQRSLLFIEIPIRHDSVEHGLAYSEEAVGIHPVIKGVERRRE